MACQTLTVKYRSTFFRSAAATAAASESLLAIRYFGEVRELVGTEKLFTTFSYLVETCVSRFVDSVCHIIAFNSSLESTLIFGFEEQLPSHLCERHGEFFDIVWTTSRVNHLVEVTFFLEEELLVACDTFAKFVRLLVRSVEWSDGDFVNWCESCRHSLSLWTEHVYVWVKQGLAVTWSGCVHHHLASAVASRVVLLHDLSPKHTCCTEFCQFHEIYCWNAHVELDAVCHFVGGETCFGQLCHPFVTPRERVTEFLVNVCTSVAKHFAIYRENTKSLNWSHNLEKFSSYLSHVVRELLAFLECSLVRVEVDRTNKLVGSTLLFEVCYESLSKFYNVLRANDEVYLGVFGVNTFKKCVEIEIFTHFET